MILSGNIQDVREQLAELLNDATPDGWTATAESRPSPYTGLIHVGHTTEITPASYQTFGCTLPITLWADETGDVMNAAALYGLLSPVEGSLLRFFNSKACPFTDYQVGEVAPRRPNDEGPSVFLACEITVRFQVTTT